ncbi:hypothetical protein ACWGQ5_30335 [Streptomyces sp. NPDC055722]
MPADLDEDLDAVGRPVHLIPPHRRVIGTHLTVGTGAHQGTGDVRQAQAEGIAFLITDELEQVRNDHLPVADLRPERTAAQFMGERGQRHDLARQAAAGEAVVDERAVGLSYTRVQQGGCGHERGVDLLSAGRIIRLVGEQQIHLAGGLLGTALGHVRFLLSGPMNRRRVSHRWKTRHRSRPAVVQAGQVGDDVRGRAEGAIRVALAFPQQEAVLFELPEPALHGRLAVAAAARQGGDGHPPAVPVRADQSEQALRFEAQPAVAEEAVGDLSRPVPRHHPTADLRPEVTHRHPPRTRPPTPWRASAGSTEGWG